MKLLFFTAAVAFRHGMGGMNFQYTSMEWNEDIWISLPHQNSEIKFTNVVVIHWFNRTGKLETRNGSISTGFSSNEMKIETLFLHLVYIRIQWKRYSLRRGEEGRRTNSPPTSRHFISLVIIRSAHMDSIERS